MAHSISRRRGSVQSGSDKFCRDQISSIGCGDHDGPKNDQFIGGLPKLGAENPSSRVDWELSFGFLKIGIIFTIPPNAALAKLFKDDPNLGKPVPAPLLNIYIGGGDVDFSKIKIPGNLHVRDERKQIK